MSTPAGRISTPNITPDKATGIGDWTDDEFYRALHEGIGRHGEYLYPAFPFPWFTRVSRDDVLAIKAYLFSLPPANAPRRPNALRFPFNIRDTLWTWRTLFFKPAEPAAAPPPGDSAARGGYLVEGLGHCGECHNQHNILGASEWSGRLEGGPIEGWYAPNITSDGRQGVGQWGEDQIVQFLKTGAAPDKGVALGPMRETIDDSLKYLADGDLRAIAAYLKSSPAREPYRVTGPGGFVARNAPGVEVYLSNCASCHGLNGQGLKGSVPALAGNGAVTAQGPQDAIRVVLGGLPALNGFAPMPAVGTHLSDAQVANVVDYVRNAFGNSAPAATGGGEVAKLRAETRTMMAASDPSLCGAVSDNDVVAALKGEEAVKLKQTKAKDILETIDDLLARVRSASPNFNRNSVVDSLTAAYCKDVFTDPNISQAQRAERLGNFAVLLYGQILWPEAQN